MRGRVGRVAFLARSGQVFTASEIFFVIPGHHTAALALSWHFCIPR